MVLVLRGRRFSDHFGDGVYGGRDAALVAAQRFRDELLLEVGPDTRVRRKPVTGRRGSTKVVGVSLERNRVGGRVYLSYSASWPDPEKGFGRRRFLVSRYGRDRALALAIEAREAGVARYHAYLLGRQQKEARKRLRTAPPLPRQVKHPLDRKGISMSRRRLRSK